jgi:mono/diheme cytochrome c family protein
MIRKILKWTGITILSVILILVIVVAGRQNLRFDAPYPAIKASADSAVIAHGKEIAYGPAHCADCHYAGNADSVFKLGQEPALSGGRIFELPLGNFYVRNITSDSITGIGRYTDGEIARVLRYGVRPNGTAVIDFMPFHDMSDEDLTAVISFLRSSKPVRNPVPDHTVTMLGRVIKAFMIKPVGPTGEVPKSIPRDTTAVYGKYLANSVANCAGCHTNRDLMTGAFIGEPFAGGLKFEESGVPTLISPNINPNTPGRLYGWSQQDFINRFRMGKTIAYSHMPWNSFKRMSDNDLKAIYNFLKSLPAATAKADNKK